MINYSNADKHIIPISNLHDKLISHSLWIINKYIFLNNSQQEKKLPFGGFLKYIYQQIGFGLLFFDGTKDKYLKYAVS